MTTSAKVGALLFGLCLGRCIAAQAPPDLNGGIWQLVSAPQSLKTVDGRAPPLLPAAAQVYSQHLAAAKTGDRSWDGTRRCLAPGLPRLLYMQPGGFEFLQQPEQIVMTYTWNHMVRVINMEASEHKVAGQTYEGQSIGRWDGRTLVVDTIGFNEATVLDSTGLPHSDVLHVVERYSPGANGREMTLRIRVEDPKTFATPWETMLRLKHIADGTISEDVCLERMGIHWDTRKKGT